MPEEIIDLADAERTAERYVSRRIKNVKEIVIEAAKLSSIGNMTVYEVEGLVTSGGGVFSKSEERLFKVQISSTDGKVVGYQI